jgi:hypothetical protein
MNWKIIVLSLATLAAGVWTIRAMPNGPVQPTAPAVTLTAQPTYQVVATRPAAMFAKGTEFPAGSAAYFYQTAPQLTYTPTYIPQGVKAGALQGEVETTVTLQTLDANGQLYWTKLLSRQRGKWMLRGDRLVSEPVVLRPAEVYPTFATTNQQLNVLGGKSLLVIESVARVNGRVIGLTMPVELGPTAFTMPRAESVAVTRTLAEAGGAGRAKQVQVYVPLAVTVLFAGLLVAQLWLSWQSSGRRRFARWITAGTISIQPSYVVPIATLGGLVDVAMDLNSRVIFDPERNLYAVFVGAYMYRYKG